MERLHMNALCQVLRLEGVKPGSEARIEGELRSLAEHNGPEFVIARLKQLKQHTLDNLDKVVPYRNNQGEQSIKWNFTTDSPKGSLGLIYRQFPNPVTRVRVIGSIIESISLDTLSRKQTEKFLSGVLSRDRSAVSHIHFSSKTLMSMEESLRKQWSGRELFGAQHLTASSLPYGPEGTIPIDKYKMTLADLEGVHPDLDAANKAIAMLDKHAIRQFKTAPPSSQDYVRKMLSIAGNPNVGRKFNMHPYKARPYEALREDVWFPEYAPYVGNFAMLQQGGGKLRSICNVNRYVNYALEPFAKAIEHAYYYRAPQIAVKDQQEGLRWAQEQLRKGTRLASMDLTSATDLLDFRVVTRGLQRLGDSTPMLTATAQFFEEMAQLPLYSKDLDAGLHFNTGQPLGMAGSFQILTLMNYLAGRFAARSCGLPEDCFRVVGDDMICDARIAKAYGDQIELYRGKSNAEKALTSSRYGEFLSHIITPSMIHIMKPKYRAGYHALFVNAEKSTLERTKHVYRMSRRDRDAIDIIAAYSDHRNSNIPYIRSAKRAPVFDRMLMSRALDRLASYTRGGIPTELTVSRNTIELAHEQFPQVLGREPGIAKWDRKDPASSVTAARGSVHHDYGVFPVSVDKYDHHTGERVDINELAARQSLKGMTRLYNLMSKVEDDYRNGVEHIIELPNGISVSTTDELIGALYDLEEEGWDVGEVAHKVRQELISSGRDALDLPER